MNARSTSVSVWSSVFLEVVLDAMVAVKLLVTAAGEKDPPHFSGEMRLGDVKHQIRGQALGRSRR